MRVYFSKEGMRELCNACGELKTIALPDVYFPGRHKDPNIVDNMGNEILIESKQHKQRLLKERGWVEAGLGKNNRYYT